MSRTAATIYILAVVLECASLMQASSGSHDIKSLLEDHHKVRSEPEPSAANMEKLEWNDALASQAEDRARECVFKQASALGENQFYSPDSQADYGDAVDIWLDEWDNYDYIENRCYPSKTVRDSCRRYKQMLWAKSNQLGCGAEVCPTLKIEGGAKSEVKNALFIVCKYHPRMNAVDRPYIKGPACSKCPPARPKCQDSLCTT